MDIKKLTEIGIICSTQKKTHHLPKDTITIIHNNKFIFVKHKTYFRLRHIESNKYLFAFDGKLELVEFSKNNFFLDNSLFIILVDEVCCSIFSSKDYNLVLSLENDKLILKNIYLCFADNTLTIFKLSKLEKPKVLKKIILQKNKNLVKASGLDQIFLKKKNFTIITNSNNFNNKKLYNFTFYQNLSYTKLYLDYIISNYEKLTEYSIFSPKIKELDSYIMKLDSKKVVTEIDHIITLDGYRYKFIEKNGFSSWKDTGEKMDLRDFCKKVLKKIPNKKYIEYCSYFFYIVPKKNILQHKLLFYQNLLNLVNENIYNQNILDKCWYHLFS